MRPLTVPDSENVILALQDEIRRNDEAKYDHRLHGLLLVAQGMTAPEVGRLLGDAPRTVAYWVTRFEETGLAGLAEGARSGRPARLTPAQMRTVESVIRKKPYDVGLSGATWDGKTLSAFLQDRLEVDLGVRQCQRLFRALGFRLRKPPGTSKWNKIEHRLFSFISINWQGVPLETYAIILSLIRATRTKAGLSVKARLDRKTYQKGDKIPKETIAAVRVRRDEKMPTWNYTIVPRKKRRA